MWRQTFAERTHGGRNERWYRGVRAKEVLLFGACTLGWGVVLGVWMISGLYLACMSLACA